MAENINVAKEIAQEIRELTKGDDLSNILGDFLFSIEVKYQAYHNLDENNFDCVHESQNE